jgi:hypothetical protein
VSDRVQLNDRSIYSLPICVPLYIYYIVVLYFRYGLFTVSQQRARFTSIRLTVLFDSSSYSETDKGPQRATAVSKGRLPSGEGKVALGSGSRTIRCTDRRCRPRLEEPPPLAEARSSARFETRTDRRTCRQTNRIDCEEQLSVRKPNPTIVFIFLTRKTRERRVKPRYVNKLSG